MREASTTVERRIRQRRTGDRIYSFGSVRVQRGADRRKDDFNERSRRMKDLARQGELDKLGG